MVRRPGLSIRGERQHFPTGGSGHRPKRLKRALLHRASTSLAHRGLAGVARNEHHAPDPLRTTTNRWTHRVPRPLCARYQRMVGRTGGGEPSPSLRGFAEAHPRAARHFGFWIRACGPCHQRMSGHRVGSLDFSTLGSPSGAVPQAVAELARPVAVGRGGPSGGTPVHPRSSSKCCATP